MLPTMNLASTRRIEKVMKRNFDLVRAILLQVEHEGDPEEPLITSIAVEGQDQPLTNEHVKLMIESGLLEGDCKFSTNNRILLTAVRGLTPRGYDFLDNIRNEGVWKKIKEHITGTVGSASLDVFESFANQIIKSAVSRPRQGGSQSG